MGWRVYFISCCVVYDQEIERLQTVSPDASASGTSKIKINKQKHSHFVALYIIAIIDPWLSRAYDIPSTCPQ